MKATLNLFGHTYNTFIDVAEYRNGATAVQALDASDGSCVVTVSTNIEPFSGLLPSGTFYGKHWSENEGVLEQLQAQGIIILVPEIPPVSSGWVGGIRAYRLKS